MQSRAFRFYGCMQADEALKYIVSLVFAVLIFMILVGGTYAVTGGFNFNSLPRVLAIGMIGLSLGLGFSLGGVVISKLKNGNWDVVLEDEHIQISFRDEHWQLKSSDLKKVVIKGGEHDFKVTIITDEVTIKAETNSYKTGMFNKELVNRHIYDFLSALSYLCENVQMSKKGVSQLPLVAGIRVDV